MVGVGVGIGVGVARCVTGSNIVARVPRAKLISLRLGMSGFFITSSHRTFHATCSISYWCTNCTVNYPLAAPISDSSLRRYVKIEPITSEMWAFVRRVKTVQEIQRVARMPREDSPAERGRFWSTASVIFAPYAQRCEWRLITGVAAYRSALPSFPAMPPRAVRALLLLMGRPVGA